MLKVFKDFFACKIVFDANHHYPESIKRIFPLQNCLRRKSSLSWKYAKFFSPAKLSSTQITIILKIFKDFFTCNIVFHANHHYPGKIQRLFRLQNCLRRKSSFSWKYSKTFWLQNCLSRKSFILKTFKDFSACKIVFDANHLYPENIQKFFRLQYCLIRKSSLCWKYSKTFSPAKMSSTQITIILKIFKDFFTCNIVLDANHHYPESIQKFFPCKIVFDANHHYPENMQNFSRLQNCLRHKSSLCWKYSKTFSPTKLSSTQITIILKIFKDFFACNIVLDANHHYPGEIQRLFRLQNCLRRKSSFSWKYSKTFLTAKLS